MHRSKNRVLIIGGGIAGAAAADRLSRGGAEVHLIEKQADIGGRVREMGCKATDVCMRCNVCVADQIFRSVRESSGIRLHTSIELLELRPGRNGSRYTAVLGRDSSATKTVDADSIVIAIGYEPYNPIENSSYGYGNIPNVMTGVEAEQQLSAKYRIVRPSDGHPPKRIAFIQCVGSRTGEIYRRPEDTDYCSTVCCSYALRMAQLIKHQAGESEITVFYMDIQKFGKGFDAFYKACKDKMRFVRSRPYELRAGSGGTVRVKYAPEGGHAEDGRSVCEEEFDLVVLSVGIRPPSDGLSLANKLGVAMDEQGFFGLKGASDLPDLQKQGIFVAGASESPKDIAGCIAQAEAVSAMILRGLPGKASAKAGRTRKGSGKGISRDVVVIGGGIAGMRTSVALAKLGHQVALLHRDKDLGGRVMAAPELYGYLGPDLDKAEKGTRDFAAQLVGDVKDQKNIAVYPEASLKSVDGEQGNFSVILNRGGKTENFRAGAVVLATGLTPSPVATGRSPVMVSMCALLAKMRGGNQGKRVAIVLDTASEHGRRVWAQVLTTAEMLVKRRGVQVKVYCNNVRVAATGLESLYRRAREAGTVIVKFDKRPIVSEEGAKAVITSVDTITGGELSEEFDLAVIVDRQGWTGSAEMFSQVGHLRPGPDGELQYDNVWLLPGLTNRPGVFAVGAARGDTEYREALTDGLAAANEIHALLSGDEIEVRDDVATVDADKCVLCLTCLRVCPHGAITIDTEKNAAHVSPVSCKRCGTCAAECPAQAITLPGFTDEQMAAEIGDKPWITVFACENSAVPAAEAAGRKHGKSVNIIKVPCAGDVDPRMVLSALESGASKVMILGCHPESCQYLSGSSRALKRMHRLAGMLEKAGFDGSRVSFNGISAVEPGKFEEIVKGEWLMGNS